MRKLTILTSVFVLASCGGGSGSNPAPSNIIDELTVAEQLFGQGNGTGAIPTNLLTSIDNLGTEYFSFGAWGKIYEIKEKSGQIVIRDYPGTYYPAIRISAAQNSHLYDFTGQQNAQINQWRFDKDASVADAVYTGPAIMYAGPGWGGNDPLANYSDYGTVKIKFGHDISDSPSAEFIMSDPTNNINTHINDMGFSEDRNNIYIWKIIVEDTGYHPYKIYKGFGQRN